MNNLKCSQHFQQRFDQRVTRKTKRMEQFMERAYYDGEKLEDITNKPLRRYIEAKEKAHGSVAKIYHGNIYWFTDGVAVTIYQVPRCFRRAF